MELFNFHFNNLKIKQLDYNQFSDTYNCPSGIKNHIYYPSFKRFFQNMINDIKGNQLLIIETGCTSFNDDDENDIQSTVLFNNLVSKYGGIFFTCDKNKNKIDNITKKIISHNIRPINMDSVLFFDSLIVNLKNNDKLKRVIIHIYLNNYDKNKSYVQNANQCINEYITIQPYLTKGSQIIINTYNDDNFTSLIKKELPNDKLIIDKEHLLYLF